MSIYCPKCKGKNPKGRTTCIDCEFSFSEMRTCRLAKTALALGLSSLILNIIASIPGLITGFLALRFIKKSDGMLTGKKLAITGILLCMIWPVLIGLFFLWSIDAPPIENDYTVADLKYPGPEYDVTWELLNGLEDIEIDPEQLSEVHAGMDLDEIISDINNSYDLRKVDEKIDLNDRAKTIERLWERSKANREIIRKLGQYEQVADLTKPQHEFNGNYKIYQKVNLIYYYYITFQISQGKDLSASKLLFEIRKVNLKLAVNARDSFRKMSCLGCLSGDYAVANYLINQSSTSNETLVFLKNNMEFLNKEHISLRNTILYEYISRKKAWDEELESVLPNLPIPITKRNSTLRLLKNHFDSFIAYEKEEGIDYLNVWPIIYSWMPELIPDDAYYIDLKYKIYNPVGAKFYSMMIPSLEVAIDNARKTAMREDLCRIALAMRMGQDYSLEGRYSDKFIIDKKRKIIYKPGNCEKGIDCEDCNFKLPINPEVLGLQ